MGELYPELEAGEGVTDGRAPSGTLSRQSRTCSPSINVLGSTVCCNLPSSAVQDWQTAPGRIAWHLGQISILTSGFWPLTLVDFVSRFGVVLCSSLVRSRS